MDMISEPWGVPGVSLLVAWEQAEAVRASRNPRDRERDIVSSWKFEWVRDDREHE
jgi:hypothetical protein